MPTSKVMHLKLQSHPICTIHRNL